MDIEVTSRGPVAERTKLLVREEISRLERQAKGPLIGARVVLIQEENPRIPLPARAEGEVTLAGRPVRARVAAATMDAAVDELAERLGRRLHGQVDRLVTRRREPAESPPGEWRHGSLPTARPERSFRPPEERQIERTKSFGMEPMTAEQAALELDALDHDFFLFRDADTGSDAVLYRRDDGHLAVIDVPGVAVPEGAGPARERSRISGPIDLRSAVREMDELGHRFLFFVNADSGRGNVLYLRYDGHYGLIEPAP
jgi:ribosome-associated translation inhibitor RaiA